MAYLTLKLEHVAVNISPNFQEELDALETPLVAWDDLLSFKDSHYIGSDNVGNDIITLLDTALKAELMTAVECYIDDVTFVRIDFTDDSTLNEVKSLIDTTTGWDVLHFSCVDDAAWTSAQSVAGNTPMTEWTNPVLE